MILHHGQLCFSTERIIVIQSVYDKFIKLLASEMSLLSQAAGNAVNEQGAKRAQEMLLEAQSHAAKFIVGGPEFASPDDRISLRPTLLENVTPDCTIWDEETFGPSASVYAALTEEDAIAKANNSSYGLSASIHSTNWERALRIAKDLHYGQVQINSMTVGDSGKVNPLPHFF